MAVGVAIDRRAWCRVETGVEGVEIESKDALRKARGRSLSEIPGSGPLALAARVLRGLGVEEGVRVVTQSRVPEGSGLGEAAAVAVALAGAASRALGRPLEAPDVARVAGEAGAPLADGFLAARGAALALAADPGGDWPAPLAVDPARVEESLLLIQCEEPMAGIGGAQTPAVRALAGRVLEALVEGRFEDVVDLWLEEWAVREAGAPESARRIAGIVREAGGAVRLCGGRGGSVLLAWAPPGARGPGRREALLQAARGAGLRLFPARVDLRGLDVE
jgi:hypothetical protein